MIGLFPVDRFLAMGASSSSESMGASLFAGTLNPPHQLWSPPLSSRRYSQTERKMPRACRSS
jgi:hypothetical protein